MNVTASTLPRKSVSATRFPDSAVSANCGAGPTTGKRASSLAVCAHAGTHDDSSDATKNTGRRERTYATSGLEFPFQFVEVSPIGALSDELLRVRFDHPDFMEAQRVETQRTVRVEGAPRVVGQLRNHLQRNVVPGLVAFLPQVPGGLLRFPGADVRGLEDGAQSAFRCNGILTHEFPACGKHAAVVL